MAAPETGKPIFPAQIRLQTASQRGYLGTIEGYLGSYDKTVPAYPLSSADLAWQIRRELTDGEGAAMARNNVQFQKGLSEAAFDELYGTEEKCRAVVMASRWPNGFECPACGGRAYSEVTTRRLFQCSA